MTKLIGVLIIVLVIFGGYELFELWSKYDSDRDLKEKEALAAKQFSPDSLPGLPDNLLRSYDIAKTRGAVGLHDWLKAYGPKIQDPRRAWIELDYVVLIARDDPAEAKKIFADVKGRIPQTSPVYSRVKQLEKTYE
ncbi:MAG: hypothetical protein JWQ04_1503 [Pedosphaera sp.]|nr:hypothetical protein [Pedosphaera sp.]